ncbi:hypothetical protein AAY473_012680 [Plecturocebus cupreus]
MRTARELTLDPEAQSLMEPRVPSRPLPSQILKLRSRESRGRSWAPQAKGADLRAGVTRLHSCHL